MLVFESVRVLVGMVVFVEVYFGICVLIVGCVCSRLHDSRFLSVRLVVMGICSRGKYLWLIFEDAFEVVPWNDPTWCMRY